MPREGDLPVFQAPQPEDGADAAVELAAALQGDGQQLIRHVLTHIFHFEQGFEAADDGGQGPLKVVDDHAGQVLAKAFQFPLAGHVAQHGHPAKGLSHGIEHRSNGRFEVELPASLPEVKGQLDALFAPIRAVQVSREIVGVQVLSLIHISEPTRPY